MKTKNTFSLLTTTGILLYSLFISGCSLNNNQQSLNDKNNIVIDDTTITYKKVGNYLITEGDIIIGKTTENINTIKNRIKNMISFNNTQFQNKKNTLSKTRGGIISKTSSFLWPNNTLVYRIDTSFTSDEITSIKSALNVWASEIPGLKFQECPNCNSNTDHVFFDDTTVNTCSSYVGRIGGQQEISLGWCKGSGYIYDIAHEIGHTLGFFHPMSRYDRNEHINIIWNNVPNGVLNGNFSNNNYGVDFGDEYDYDSIMHYSWTTYEICEYGDDCFDIDLNVCDYWYPCMDAHGDLYGLKMWMYAIDVNGDMDITNTLKMGQKDHLSTIDISKMKYLYPIKTYNSPCDIPSAENGGTKIYCCNSSCN